MTRKRFHSLYIIAVSFFCAFFSTSCKFSQEKSVIKTIEALSTVKEVSVAYKQYDWKNIYMAQMLMQDGSIIQMSYIKFNNSEELCFEEVHRFGNIVPRTFRYDKIKKEIDMHGGGGAVFYRYPEIPLHNELANLVHNRNAIDLLLNYEKINEILQRLPVVDSSVLSYWGEEQFGSKKTDKEYLELVLNEHSYETDDFIYGYFATNADDDFFGQLWQRHNLSDIKGKPLGFTLF